MFSHSARRGLAVLSFLMVGTALAVANPAPTLADNPGAFGVVGCSNTNNAVTGYWDVSQELNFWDGQDGQGSFSIYGGDVVESWADPNADVWDRFDQELGEHPDTVLIWWQLCIFRNANTPESTVDAVVDLIRQRTTAPIYVSPLDKSVSCNRGDPEHGEVLADYLVNSGQAFHGPVMTPLSGAQMKDDCHASETGNDIWGADLAEFFDGDFQPGPGSGPFLDVPSSHVFADNIIWMVDNEITLGCTADGLYFCPEANVTRGQMASFIDRAWALPATGQDFFTDDETSTHEASINRVAAAGITLGCDASGTLFCPNDPVTREQMASFILRAAPTLADTNVDYFDDDDGSTHEDNINRLAHNAITLGCDPNDARLYCPTLFVTRGQMAAFIHRTFVELGQA